MKRIIFAIAAALVALPAMAQDRTAGVVSVCGTPTATLVVGQRTYLTVNDDGQLCISGTISVPGADGAILDGVTATIKATVLDLMNTNPLATAIVDANGTQITSFGGGTQYTEDAAAAADPIGTALTLIRDDVPGALVTADGDNVAARGGNFGNMYVTLLDSAGAFIPTSSGGVGASDANTTRTVGAQQLPFRSLDLDETEEEVKATAGELCMLVVTNTATATRWVKVYNATAASVVVGTTTPTYTFGIPGNTSDDVMAGFAGGNGCVQFTTAITLAATTGVADADTGAPAANDVIVNAGYR